jgi:hypothetical protein
MNQWEGPLDAANNSKKNRAGIVFLAAGGGRTDRAGPDGAKGTFFMTLQPRKEYKQDLRQPVGSLSPTIKRPSETETS